MIIFEHKIFGRIQLEISRGRGVSLLFDNTTGELIVKSPRKIEFAELEKILLKHHKWIIRHQNKIHHAIENGSNHTFDETDSFFYLGKKYPLRFGDNCQFTGNAFELVLGEEAEIRRQLELIYRELAINYLSCHVKFVAAKFKIEYAKVKVNKASTRWGSCNSRGNINFPWNLIMCPEEVVDYVVIHELAHRLEMNHSAKFWANVANMCPNYAQYRKYLKDNSLIYSTF